MSPIILGILINLPLLIAAVMALIFWSNLKHRCLFIVTASLSLLGLQDVIFAPLIGAFLPTSGLTSFTVLSAFEQGVVASAFVSFIVGVPFLWWLQHAFQNPNIAFKRDALKRAP